MLDGNEWRSVRQDGGDFATLGRAGKITGTRELIPHESYRLVYEVDDETATVWVRRSPACWRGKGQGARGKGQGNQG